MNDQPTVPNTPTVSPAPAASALLATRPAAVPEAHVDYRAVIEKAGFIASPALVAAVTKRHRDMLSSKVIWQVFQSLQKEEAERRVARIKEGVKS